MRPHFTGIILVVAGQIHRYKRSNLCVCDFTSSNTKPIAAAMRVLQACHTFRAVVDAQHNIESRVESSRLKYP